MRRKRQRTNIDSTPWEGRDELNLAEFPIALLASRPNAKLKTIQFTDCIWDKGRESWVTRRLTISASDRYGLPTSLDDEVILGLIQLTRENGFEDRKVFFSRYRLLQVLGWRNEGKSYSRLETSLKRWLGVTFFYENAWWDKAAQSWVDENFHILEQVSIYDRQRRVIGSGAGEPSLSMFFWNEVVFRSFRSGYLKQIDMELFRRLQSPIAKRLFRLLDKRFYHKSQWVFDLHELAFEHVGLSRNYDTGQLKRKLLPAIAELEAAGYLKPLTAEERFIRIRTGQWQALFAKTARKSAAAIVEEPRREVRAKLRERGVSPLVAAELASQYPVDEIKQRIEVVDWLLQRKDRRAPKNPAGYLVQSIRTGYETPDGFPSSSEARDPAEGTRCKGDTDHRRRRASGAQQATVDHRLDEYISSLAPAKRKRLEEEAIAKASPVLAACYQRVTSEGQPLLTEVYRRIILEKHLAHAIQSPGRRSESKQ